ncbi:MAG TPA: S41 family peptidase [Chthoniobacteraceae bacterium]|nr:S41 family peptidase [Chthoniobacteraceae bacterium]
MIDSLSPSDLSDAINKLKTNYVDPASLNDQELSRATLQGLVARLAPGAAIFAKAPEPPAPSPFHSEVLPGDIGYLRLGSLTKENLGKMDDEMKNFHDKDVKSIILDLRATPDGDFDMAAQVIERFAPKGKTLFTVKKPGAKDQRVVTSDTDPVVRAIVIVLVDGDTGGAGEVIAGALRIYTNAMIVGSNTPGRAVEYSDIPLSGGKILRVAVSEVVLSDGSAIFPKGIKPDVAVEMPRDVKTQVMQQSLEKGVGPFVFETERPHFNEAALVGRTNPDLDAAEAAQKERQAGGVHPAPPLRDTVLQHALDLITSIAIYEGKPPDTVKPPQQ